MDKKLIIFSDFDGTITERDVIITIMEKFAPSEWVEIKDKVLYKRTITLKDGVEKLFSLIDSNKKNEIINYVKQVTKIRSGFDEFLDFCKDNQTDFYVVSGGLDFFIEAVLEKHLSKLTILCNKGNFNSERIKIDYSYLPKNCSLCGTCGFCKIEIIEKYPRDKYTRVLIGDSLTDLSPSKVADIVFARSDLIKYLEEEKIPYIPFQTFYDVMDELVKRV